MATTLTSGIGDTTGDRLATCRPLQISGNVWYVSNANGVNGVSPAGQDRTKPLATLAQAITNADDDDIIVCLSGHTETLTAVQNIAKSVSIVGGGLSDGKPTVKFSLNAAGNPKMFDVSAANVEFRNLWIQGNAQDNTSMRINLQAAGFRIIGCYMECGAHDKGTAVAIHTEASFGRIVNTTFISTATSLTAQPLSAITPLGCSDLELDGLILSDGPFGFSQYWAYYDTIGVNRLKGLSVSLLLGADMALAGSTGYLNIQTSSSGARLDW